MGSFFVLVGPVPGENLVGLAAEQEVELLVEEVVDLFAALLTEIGHRPASELEALGRIFGRPAGRLHDAIHGNLGTDDNLPHWVTLLVELRDRKSTRLNSSHTVISYAVFCLKKKTKKRTTEYLSSTRIMEDS